MCNVEFMVMSRVYQRTLEEDAKKARREATRISAFMAQSAEEMRQSIEEESLAEWYDTETRKVNAALGAAKVASAAAGLEILSVTNDWAQAHVQLAGAKAATRRRQAAAGDIREAEIESVKQQRLKQFEGAGALDWMMDIGTAFAQGVALEQRMTGEKWDGNIFGIQVGGLFGMDSTEKQGGIPPSQRPGLDIIDPTIGQSPDVIPAGPVGAPLGSPEVTRQSLGVTSPFSTMNRQSLGIPRAPLPFITSQSYRPIF